MFDGTKLTLIFNVDQYKRMFYNLSIYKSRIKKEIKQSLGLNSI